MKTLSFATACGALLSLATVANAAVEKSHALVLHLGGYASYSKLENEDLKDGQSGNIELQYQYTAAATGEISWFLGGGLAGRSSEPKLKDNTDVTYKIGTFGLIVDGGMVYSPAHWYQLRVGPAITLGSAAARVESSVGSADSDSGSYASLDLRADNNFIVAKHLLLNVGLGVGSQAAKVTIESEDGTFKGASPFLYIGIGYIF